VFWGEDGVNLLDEFESSLIIVKSS